MILSFTYNLLHLLASADWKWMVTTVVAFVGLYVAISQSRNYRIQQRAWVTVQPREDWNYPQSKADAEEYLKNVMVKNRTIYLEVVNKGLTPATLLRSEQAIALVDSAFETEQLSLAKETGDIGEALLMPSEIHLLKITLPWHGQFIRDLAMNRKYFFVVGAVTYSDSFGRTHTVRWQFSVHPSMFLKEGQKVVERASVRTSNDPVEPIWCVRLKTYLGLWNL